MADKKQKKGSIYDRWDNEVAEQFKTEKASEEDLKRIKELQKSIENKQFRDFIDGKKK